MQLKTVLTTAIAVTGIAAFGAGNAYGQAGTDFVWDGGGGDGDWRNEDNWNHNSGYPNSADDTAVIDPASATPVALNLNTGSVTVGQLTIGELATLTVTLTSGNNYLVIDRTGDEDGVLTIQDDGSNQGVLNIGNATGDGGRVKFNSDLLDSHQIGGLIQLPDDDSELRVVTGSAGGAAFDPYMSQVGEIVMADAGALIVIEEPKSGDKAFVNNILLHGEGTIDYVPAASGTGTASFVNEHEVWADAPGGGTLEFAAGVQLDDPDTANAAMWAASGSGAVLKFSEEATNLYGEFQLEASATLLFLASITTSGDFEDNPRCGTVDASASGVCFSSSGGLSLCSTHTYSVGCP